MKAAWQNHKKACKKASKMSLDALKVEVFKIGGEVSKIRKHLSCSIDATFPVIAFTLGSVCA